MDSHIVPQKMVFHVPIVTLRHFAALSGQSEEVVRGWADKGHIPTTIIGRHRMVDLTRMTQK
jgi:hypothetical protein